MIIDEEEYLAHYGTPRHSGRYPWGSGGNEGTPQQRSMSFIDQVNYLKSQGLSPAEVAKGMGLESTTQLRAKYTIAVNERRQSLITQAQALKDKGVSDTEGARMMGIPGATYRSYLATGAKDKQDNFTSVANLLKQRVDEIDSPVPLLDVGSGNEAHLGISEEKLKVALSILQDQGYVTHIVPVTQQGQGHQTKTKVLTKAGIDQTTAWQNRDNIQTIFDFSDDGGRTFAGIHEPIAVDPKRLKINYADEGGREQDGVIYVRPGVKDLEIGQNRYAQVRIKVGDGHYLKGMAIYKEDLPKGVDLVFNTNKDSTGNKLDALKKIETLNKDYPFGTIVRQIIENPGTPEERVTSAMNIVGSKEGSGEEGAWGEWSKTLSSQFLSKQSPTLVKNQLDKTYANKQKEFDEINGLTNPAVKKKLLESFADETDSSAVDLKAAPFRGSIWHVILPVTSMKPTEVYAPGFKNGEHVALVRYPHGGTFEIPELIVNNRNREGTKLLGQARDAIGIHPDVAKRLSGADFDGDTVLVIPNDSHKVKSTPALEGLKDFDPIHEYPGYEGMTKMSKEQKGMEMGKISNLITDMTLRGATREDLSRAIRHSMVVIDAEKHGLNWKESEKRNGISALKKKYQAAPYYGASTLISRQNKDVDVPDRRTRYASEGGPIDDKGHKVFVPTGKMKRNKNGELVPVMGSSKLLAETPDAHDLSSGTKMEGLYADHSNRLKALAGQARIVSHKTPPVKRNPSAARNYGNEVKSLNAKLDLIKKNRPKERQAQVLAGAAYKARIQDNPDLDKSQKKKVRFAEQEKARLRLGAKQEKVQITPREWEAIQAGAISNHHLNKILDKADMQTVRKLATPRHKILMTPTQTRRAEAMLRRGATRAEVAAQLGVSVSTLDLATTGS